MNGMRRSNWCKHPKTCPVHGPTLSDEEFDRLIEELPEYDYDDEVPT